MDKEILTFRDIEIEKKLTVLRLLFFKKCRYCKSISI